MTLREASPHDVEQIMNVRLAVRENKLSEGSSIDEAVCVEYLTNRGKGWVTELDNEIVGFSIVDLVESNVWALFVLPNFEGKGIGVQLQNAMLDWYFTQSSSPLWLTTSKGTRAEGFYRKTGWQDVGILDADEIKFEMSHEDWKKRRSV